MLVDSFKSKYSGFDTSKTTTNMNVCEYIGECDKASLHGVSRVLEGDGVIEFSWEAI